MSIEYLDPYDITTTSTPLERQGVTRPQGLPQLMLHRLPPSSGPANRLLLATEAKFPKSVLIFSLTVLIMLSSHLVCFCGVAQCIIGGHHHNTLSGTQTMLRRYKEREQAQLVAMKTVTTSRWLHDKASSLACWASLAIRTFNQLSSILFMLQG